MLEKLKVSIHQINTITGDLVGNTNKIKEMSITRSKNR